MRRKESREWLKKLNRPWKVTNIWFSFRKPIITNSDKQSSMNSLNSKLKKFSLTATISSLKISPKSTMTTGWTNNLEPLWSFQNTQEGSEDFSSRLKSSKIKTRGTSCSLCKPSSNSRWLSKVNWKEYVFSISTWDQIDQKWTIQTDLGNLLGFSPLNRLGKNRSNA